MAKVNATYETHATTTGKILFMAAKRPLKDKVSGKEQYSIKVELDSSDPIISLLEEISPKKVHSETNRALTGTGKFVLNFSSVTAPKVTDKDNNLLTQEDIPFFDGRNGLDSGTANVIFTVITYKDTGKKVVVLSGIKLQTFNQGTREESGKSSDDVMNLIRSLN